MMVMRSEERRDGQERRSGGWTKQYRQKRRALEWDDFQRWTMRSAWVELLEAIVEREIAVSQTPHRHPVPVPASNTQGHDQAWGQNAFWHRIRRFIAPGDVIVAENGTSLAGGSSTFQMDLRISGSGAASR